MTVSHSSLGMFDYEKKSIKIDYEKKLQLIDLFKESKASSTSHFDYYSR